MMEKKKVEKDVEKLEELNQIHTNMNMYMLEL